VNPQLDVRGHSWLCVAGFSLALCCACTPPFWLVLHFLFVVTHGTMCYCSHLKLIYVRPHSIARKGWLKSGYGLEHSIVVNAIGMSTGEVDASQSFGDCGQSPVHSMNGQSGEVRISDGDVFSATGLVSKAEMSSPAFAGPDVIGLLGCRGQTGDPTALASFPS